MTFITKTAAGIPQLGFGSGTKYFKGLEESPLNENLVNIGVEALESGFIHFDSAEIYGNDAELREIVKRAKVPRNELFITEKYFAGDGTFTYHSKSSNPYERLKQFLKDTELEYVDLYLIHAPFISKETHGFTIQEAWKFVKQTLDEGIAKRIGVSNFGVEDLEKIWDVTEINPQVNQIEFSPFLQDQTPHVVEWCQSHNVQLEAYSPLAPLYKGDLTTGSGLKFRQLLDSLKAKYNKSDNQIILRWVIQRGIVPITTTSKSERLTELKGVFGWELDSKDVESINEIGSQSHLRLYWTNEYAKYDK